MLSGWAVQSGYSTIGTCALRRLHFLGVLTVTRGLVNCMVGGFNGHAQKRYRNLAKARQAWEEGPTRWSGTWTTPAPRRAIPTPGLTPRAQPRLRQEWTAADLARDTAPIAMEPNRPVAVYPSLVSAAGVTDSDVCSDTEPEDDHDTAPRSPSPLSDYTIASPTSVSSGTLSPRTIYTLSLPPSLLNTPVSRRVSITRTLSCGGDAKLDSPIKRGSASRSSPGVSHNVAATSGRSQLLSRHSEDMRFAPTTIAVTPSKHVFVVVRGDEPGVYFDRYVVDPNQTTYP